MANESPAGPPEEKAGGHWWHRLSSLWRSPSKGDAPKGSAKPGKDKAKVKLSRYPLCPHCKHEIEAFLDMDLPMPKETLKILGVKAPASREKDEDEEQVPIKLGVRLCSHCRAIVGVRRETHQSFIGTIEIKT